MTLPMLAVVISLSRTGEILLPLAVAFAVVVLLSLAVESLDK